MDLKKVKNSMRNSNYNLVEELDGPNNLAKDKKEDIKGS